MYGIVLAGGTGSRLWPITKGVSKQLLQVYDKPMIHYPIATLMAAGIRKFLIIVTQQDKAAFISLLGDGKELGLSFEFAIQDKPRGIADAFLIGEKFISGNKCALILGDNIFHGSGLGRQLMEHNDVQGAHIFAYRVANPREYGVVEFDSDGKVISIEEKPKNPRSSFAIPGLYFYDESVTEIAKQINPSDRGEIEITEINKEYLRRNALSVSVLPRGTAWLDTGSIDALHDASSYIRIIEDRQGTKVSCLEEVSWRQGWISDSELESLANGYRSSPYGSFLKSLLISGKENE